MFCEEVMGQKGPWVLALAISCSELKEGIQEKEEICQFLTVKKIACSCISTKCLIVAYTVVFGFHWIHLKEQHSNFIQNVNEGSIRHGG
jgi:hypothetical protein